MADWRTFASRVRSCFPSATGILFKKDFSGSYDTAGVSNWSSHTATSFTLNIQPEADSYVRTEQGLEKIKATVVWLDSIVNISKDDVLQIASVKYTVQSVDAFTGHKKATIKLVEGGQTI